MLPDLFSLGPLTIHTYGVFVAVGFAVAIIVTVRIARAYSIGSQQVMDTAFVGVLWGVIGSRVFFLFIYPSHYWTHPLEIFKIWEGGLVFSGGIVGAAAAMFFYSRRHGIAFRRMVDLWVPGVALGQAFGRFGCFMAGCCYGKPFSGIWGVVFTNPASLAPLNISLHPTQLYAALSGFLIFAILYFAQKRKKFEGQIALWFFILHSTSRLLEERFRADDRGMLPGTDMTLTQLVATIALIGSIVLLFILKRRHEAKTDGTSA